WRNGHSHQAAGIERAVDAGILPARGAFGDVATCLAADDCAAGWQVCRTQEAFQASVRPRGRGGAQATAILDRPGTHRRVCAEVRWAPGDRATGRSGARPGEARESMIAADLKSVQVW